MVEHRRANGDVVEAEVTSTRIRFEGRDARLVMAQDTTERRRAELALRKSESLLHIAGRAARVGGWSLDMNSGAFAWSKELSALHDLPPDSTVDVEQALAFYDPPSRAAMRKARAGMVDSGTPFDLELGIITAAGRHVAVRPWARRSGTRRAPWSRCRAPSRTSPSGRPPKHRSGLSPPT
jgi:PAS domain-containing protein